MYSFNFGLVYISINDLDVKANMATTAPPQ
jgi:hypothetical protein